MLALSAFIALAAADSAGAQLAVDRVDLTLVPRSADQQSGIITVTNTTPLPVAATVYLADWDRDEAGANRFYDLGTLPASCGSLLGVFPRTLSLPPNGTQALQVMARGADTLAAACWSIVFVETRLAPPAGESRQLSYVVRTGVKIYLVPRGLRSDGLVEAMRMHGAAASVPITATVAPTPAATDGQQLEMIFRNAGAIPLLAKGSLEIRRGDNSLAATIPLEEFPTLPGVRRRMLIAIPALAPGRYVALALIDFGGTEIVAGQLEFEAR